MVHDSLSVHSASWNIIRASNATSNSIQEDDHGDHCDFPLSFFLIISLAHYFLFGASFLIPSTYRGFQLTLLGRTIPTLELLLRQRWMFPNPVSHHITYHRERRLHDSLHDDRLVHHEPASPRKFGHGDMSEGVYIQFGRECWNDCS